MADKNEFNAVLNKIIKDTEDECGWMYSTKISNSKTSEVCAINYTVFSDILICPYCNKEYALWDAAVLINENKVLDEYQCTSCGATINKEESKKAVIDYFDSYINKQIVIQKQKPVLISYVQGKTKREKLPDEADNQLIKEIENKKIPYWFPTNPMMNIGENWGDSWRKGVHKGITHVHHFYTHRNLYALALLHDKISKIENEKIKHLSLLFFTSLYSRTHRMNRYMPKHDRHVGPLSGTLYISNFQVEINVLSIAKEKFKSFQKLVLKSNTSSFVSTQSLSSLSKVIPYNSIDYIFTDPPFGDNLMYSELNFIWESWLKVVTNNSDEVIINTSQSKTLSVFKLLMQQCFVNYYHLLKPKRWMTVEFHNSRSSVWKSIQESINKAGFIISTVSILDKKKGTTKQLSSPGAVEKDLVISAYKPAKSFEEKFLRSAGKNMEIDFIVQFLENQPSIACVERTNKMLYSKMLAYYIQRGYEIQQDSKAFYKILGQNFINADNDGYWFLPSQVSAYLEYKKKVKIERVAEISQGSMMIFIVDENSALLWLFNYLENPRSFSDISTSYTRVSEIQGDDVPELQKLLDENFVFENEKYRRPKGDAEVGTLTEKREKALMRNFESLLLVAKSSKKKITSIRKEALLHGFEMCYKQNRFEDIILLSNRLDRNIIENSAELSEFIEIAHIKVEGIK